MSAWWLIAAFLAGWAGCWYLSHFLLKRVLRRSDSMMVDVLSGLPQEKLLKVRDAVSAELEKRRSS